MNASEKDFYLRSFRHRAILIHLAAGYPLARVARVIEELRDNHTMLVVTGVGLPKRVRARRLAAKLSGETVVAVSRGMLERGVVYAARAADPLAGLEQSCAVASEIGITKVVVVDPRGGLRAAGGARSFMNAAALARLAGKRRSGGRWERKELDVMLAAVRGGISSVNLTDADGLAEELFTYEGSGTLLTADDYCAVRRVRADDFAEALALIHRGEREGFLLPRTAEARARLLLSCYGAWFEGERLAGIGSLETHAYRRSGLAEIAGLYTINRFQGEGVAAEIVESLVAMACRDGAKAVFACTRSAKAGAFFERVGFREVERGRIPASKWRGRRESLPIAYWRDC